MIVNGKDIQQKIKEELQALLQSCKDKPSLGVVLVGKDPASERFVSLKKRFGEEIGVDVWVKNLPETSQTEDVKRVLVGLDTDGVIVQLPLPKHVDEESVLQIIPKEKDVDVLNGGNFDAPVAGAVFEVLDRYEVVLNNKKIVIVGEGKLVGLPVMNALKKKRIPYDLVTLETLEDKKSELFLHADVIISGAGDPHFLKKEMVKDGVVIIDAGTSEKDAKLKGDVDPGCQEKAGLITPVPGGVGPITIAILFKNLLSSCLQ